MAIGYKHRQQVRLGFYCSQEKANALEAAAKKLEVPMTEVIRQALDSYLGQLWTV